ncbi:hypothetical protein AB0N62_29510 [Streptomyces sp. NPDC093982]|uniref:hypothetical protein n=1 Tax=Streptomyces sp. NPDC093982 TaxID=3155077 RepID=UPI003442F90C
MSKTRRGRAYAGQGSAFVGEVEGYLKAKTYYLEAREEADRLCSGMPWLTTAQAEQLTRHYIELRIGLTRQTLIHHIDDLREQYDTRYHELRRHLLRRHAAAACVLLVCVGVAGVLTFLLGR